MPTTEVLKVEQAESVDGIELTTLGYLMVGNYDNSEYTPMIYSPKISSGDTLYAMVFKPHNFKLGENIVVLGTWDYLSINVKYLST